LKKQKKKQKTKTKKQKKKQTNKLESGEAWFKYACTANV
jgi:hypothetical protein